MNNYKIQFTCGVIFVFVGIAIGMGLLQGEAFLAASHEIHSETRMAECIEALAEAMNTRDLEYDYGVVEFWYNPEHDRCLYHGNRVGTFPEGYYFERFIVDAISGDTIAEYAERNGITVAGDLTAFVAKLNDLFPADD